MSAPGHVLADVLDRTRTDQRQSALRALLMRPLLAPTDPAFALVRQHADWLRDWLARETGWTLRVEADFARLSKEPPDHQDGTRAARAGGRPADPAFSRRRYAVLCLALAALEKGENQVTLGRLGELVIAAAADPDLAAAGLRFELRTQDDRRDLVTVVRLLLDLRVLGRVAGNEEAYIQSGRDVLYDVNRRILATLLVTRRGPSLLEAAQAPPLGLAERLAALGARLVADTQEARNRALRQRLTARLLDDPVLYHADLDGDELAYLLNQRHAIAARIREATGLTPEIRAEGMALVDRSGDLTDEPMPAEGTEGHIALLLADLLAGAAGDTAPPAPVSWETLHQALAGWAKRYGRYWKKAAREPGSESALCRQAAARLAALGLARVLLEGVQPLPAVARYGAGAPRITQPRRPEPQTLPLLDEPT
jgi:uncharacterized protein (TIGR02678 family)